MRTLSIVCMLMIPLATQAQEGESEPSPAEAPAEAPAAAEPVPEAVPEPQPVPEAPPPPPVAAVPNPYAPPPQQVAPQAPPQYAPPPPQYAPPQYAPPQYAPTYPQGSQAPQYAPTYAYPQAARPQYAPPPAYAPPPYAAPPGYSAQPYAQPAYAPPAVYFVAPPLPAPPVLQWPTRPPAIPAPPASSFVPSYSPLLMGSGVSQHVHAGPTFVYPPAPAPQPSPPSYALTLQAPPLTVTLPALPPGYIYTPTGRAPAPVDVARRDELYAELTRLDTRLGELQSNRIGTGGPITMMAIGYGLAVGSALAALGSLASAEDIENSSVWDQDEYYDANGDGRVTASDEASFRKSARILGGVAGAGLLVGVLSTSRLVHRLAARRAQRVELQSVHERRRTVRQQLDYGAGVSSDQLHFSVRGAF